MSRFLLLLLFLIWLAWRSESGGAAKPVYWSDLTLFFFLYALVVVTLGLWGRLVAARVRAQRLRRGLRYFNRVVFAAQFFVPAWLAVGTFFLGWGELVQWMLGPVANWPVQLPGALIGTLPALLAWMGLWWSQYPADRALREQDFLVRLDQDLPIYICPPFKDYFRQNLRLQILFTAAPILLILALHDTILMVLWRGFDARVEGTGAEGLVTLASAMTVFITSPLLLARILGARPLPASALRDRMESMCRMHRLRFRDILLWPTQNRIANALVMGVAPRFRYVLLSDLLLEEMTDEQIEAVFAHELGHVVHRHMIWYLVFMKILILVLAMVALVLEAVQRKWLELPAWLPPDLVMTLVGFGGFLLAFGYVSRRFERQADVFAARTLERRLALHVPGALAVAEPAIAPAGAAGAGAAQPVASPPHTHVGPLGARIFSSALERVALINNMPIGTHRRFEGSLAQRLGFMLEHLADLANNWLHGSITTRMRALHRMSQDPAHTHRFDRRMKRLYFTLIAALAVSGAIAWAVRLPI